MQPVLAYLIAAILLVLAGYFGRQQVLALRRLRGDRELSPPDRSYMRNQAWLRLTSCTLMVVLAAMVAGAYLFGMEDRATELAKIVQAQRERGQEITLTPEQQQFGKLWTSYWIVVTFLLMVVVILAAIDIWTIRRYGRRHLRQIDADRRAMVENEVAILRSQRNGHH
jgi:hypothetical protein